MNNSCTLKISIGREHVDTIKTLMASGSSPSRWAQRAVMAAIEAKDVEIGQPRSDEEELAQDVIIRERSKRIQAKSRADYAATELTLYRKQQLAKRDKAVRRQLAQR